MNNTEILSDQQAGYGNRPQSLIKLPMIFASMMVFCSIILSTFGYISFNSVEHDYYITTWYFFRFFGNEVINQIVNYSIFYFCIGFIMCIDQKIHQVLLRNVLLLLLISVVYTLITAAIGMAYSIVYQLLIDDFILSSSAMVNILPIISIFTSIIKLLILVGLFKLIGAVNRNGQQTYILPQANHRKLFTFIFTVLFCLPSMMIVLLLSSWLYDVFGFNTTMSSNLLLTITALLVPTLLALFSVATIFIIIYFSVTHCFIRQFDAIPLKLLVKAVGWAYLYLIILNIVIISIYFIVSFTMTDDNSMIKLIILRVAFPPIYALIDIVGTVILCRKAVRKYFSA